MSELEHDGFLYRIASYQDGTLSATELSLLEQELREDPEKLKLFIQVQKTSVALTELLRQESFIERVVANELPEQASPSGKSLFALAMVIAASIAFFVFAGGRSKSLPPTAIAQWSSGHTDSSEHAVLTYANLASWSKSSVPVAGNLLRYRSSYSLEKGAARFELPSGAVVSVAAPTSFNILDGETINLNSGTMIARLPDSRCELKVHAGDMEIRDHGTAFGLTANENGKVNVAVFQGSVSAHVKPSDDQPAIEKVIKSGKSFSSDGKGTGLDEVPFDPKLYQDIWPLTIGIDEASSMIEFVAPPQNRDLKSLANNEKLFLVAERLGHYVNRNVGVDFFGAGQSWPASYPGRHKVGLGRTVSSYLLIYQPVAPEYGKPSSLSGSIRFQHEILGVAVNDAQLKKTDREFGLRGVDYETLMYRRLEDIDTEEGLLAADRLQISEDGHELTFQLNVGAGRDHIRILVDESEPEEKK